MLNNRTTRNLVIAVLVLGGLFLLSEKFSDSAQDRSFRSIVMKMDTSTIVAYTLQHPYDTSGVITFDRDPDGWHVAQGKYRYKADDNTVNAFLGQFEEIITMQYAGPSDAVKQRYEVDDAQGYKLEFEMADGSKQSAIIGKLGFKNDPAGRQSGKITYLRVNGEDDVYAASNMLGNDVRVEFNHWRPRYIWTGSSGSWEKLILREGDNTMTLEKKGTVWTMMGDTVIEERMESYLRAISTGLIANFNNDADVSGLEPIKSLVIYDSALDGPRSINIFELPSGQYALQSQMNPESVFAFDMAVDYRRMFRPPSYFVAVEKLMDNPGLQAQ
jgi:hypothetical protein